MRKPVIILMVCLSLVFSACESIVSYEPTNHAESTAKIENGLTQGLIAEDQMNPEIGIFSLNMEKGQIVKILKTSGINILADESHGSAGSSIWCDDIHFIFNSEGKVKEIFVSGDKNLRSVNGLKVGDGIDRMIELYGKGHSAHPEPGMMVYEYKYNLNYYNIAINDQGKVVGWGIAIDSFRGAK